MNAPREFLDLERIRARLATMQGREYWRSLEELAGTESFQQFLHREFPENASEWTDAAGRRNFLKLMGASLGLAGLAGCSAPVEKIVPYVRAPEEIIPGRPLMFATALTLSGYATGVLVESHMGRPTKIEGNPEHPASLGASDVIGQAAILGLYDPDRSQVVTQAGRISTWHAFLSALRTELEAQREHGGAGLRLLTETVTSPALAAQIAGVLREFPGARWHQYEPAGRHTVREGSRLAFGEYVETRYDFSRADVMLALDADFLCEGPGHLRYAREFARRRKLEGAPATMNRLYMLESALTSTGAVADHRLAVKSREVEAMARAIAQRLGVNAAMPAAPAVVAKHAAWIEAVAKDLQAHRGACVVLAGENQSAAVHAIAHAINAALGNVGATAHYTESVEAQPEDQMASLARLVGEMNAGKVELLLMAGGNPVYNAPVDAGFEAALKKVKFRARLGLYEDETSAECHWHVPQAHTLEAWGDARAFDGTITIQQPLILPLFGGKSAHEFLGALGVDPSRTGYNIVRAHWQRKLPGANFEKAWRRALHDGVVAGTQSAPTKPALKPLPASDATNADTLGTEIVFRTDTNVYDGQFANNGWLQELPRPLTKLVWDNAALMSPAMAGRLRLQNEDEVELTYEGRTLRAPVLLLPGHADESVTLHLGYGRRRGGRAAILAGVNAYRLRVAAAPWFCAGLKIAKTGGRRMLAVTQHHHSMEAPEGRLNLIVREGDLAEYNRDPKFAQHAAHEPDPRLTLYPQHAYPGNAWGMAIDLNACIGCNACVAACQAENNIPVVGKQEVARGREMHWIRVDRYYRGGPEAPEAAFQPVTCMHCENAPCELVCPVAATVHSDEGLNDMIYNRCVGTRYCSNNCPYKVRRFNFFQYADTGTPSLKLMQNPDVTVRTRGVMEKCTYCVQRINAARIEAELEGQPIADGKIVTACQAVCPAEAIVFGNINDKHSRVSGWKASPRNYGLLTDLNTRPRTSYLARVRNSNPEIK